MREPVRSGVGGRPFNGIVRRHVMANAHVSNMAIRLFAIGRVLQIFAVALVAVGVWALSEPPYGGQIFLSVWIPAVPSFIGGTFLVNLSRSAKADSSRLPDVEESRDV